MLLMQILLIIIFDVIISNKYLFQFKDFKCLKFFFRYKIFKNHKNFDNKILLFSNNIKHYFYQTVLLFFFHYFC